MYLTSASPCTHIAPPACWDGGPASPMTGEAGGWMRPRGRSVRPWGSHGKSQLSTAIHESLPNLWEAGAWLPLKGSHPVAGVGTAPWPAWPWPYCVASPAPCVVAGRPGLARCCFCRVRLAYKAPSGLETHRYHKGCSLGVSGYLGSNIGSTLAV